MTDHRPSSGARLSDLPSILWHVLGVPQTSIAVAGLMALALALRSLIPQMPPEAEANPQAWMALLPGILSRSSGAFHALGLFRVDNALWFHILLALTGLALFVRGYESAELAWCVRRGKGLAGAERPPRMVPIDSLGSPLPQDEVLSRVRRILVEGRFQTIGAPSDTIVIAARWPLLLWTSPLAHVALLVALASLTVTAVLDWRPTDWRPVPGERLEVGHGTSYTLRLDSIAMQPSAGGQRWNHKSLVTWSEGDDVLGQHQVSIGKPATHRGIAVHLVDIVPSVQLRGWDHMGRPLAFQAEGQEVGAPGKVDVTFSSVEARPLIYLPDQDRLLALAFAPNCPAGRPALTLGLASISDQQTPYQAETEILHQSGDVTLSGLHLEVDLSYRPILRVGHYPASSVTLASLMLALCGLATGWAVPVRLLWIDVRPSSASDTSIRLAWLPTPAGSQWASRLASELGRRLSGHV